MALGDEPEIIINGKRLSNGEAMTVRVALALLCMETYPEGGLMWPSDGNDIKAKELCLGYRACCKMITAKMKDT